MAETYLNELTGETMTPAEFMADLRVKERAVQRLDDTIAGLAAELKSAKKGRERAVSELRSAIREQKALARVAKGKGATR